MGGRMAKRANVKTRSDTRIFDFTGRRLLFIAATLIGALALFISITELMLIAGLSYVGINLLLYAKRSWAEMALLFVFTFGLVLITSVHYWQNQFSHIDFAIVTLDAAFGMFLF